MPAFRFIGEGSGSFGGQSFSAGDVVELEGWHAEKAAENWTFEAVEAAAVIAAPGDDKAELIAAIEALGGTADKRKSVATLRADLDAMLAAKAEAEGED